MSSVPGVPVLRNKKAVTVLIEQRIARGWDVQKIADRLGIDHETVLAVRDRQNQIAREGISR